MADHKHHEHFRVATFPPYRGPRLLEGRVRVPSAR